MRYDDKSVSCQEGYDSHQDNPDSYQRNISVIKETVLINKITRSGISVTEMTTSSIKAAMSDITTISVIKEAI